jgi:exosortase H (IPTLxxWG-CTERM-specific)
MIGHADSDSRIRKFIRDYRPEIKFVTIFTVGLVVAFLLVNQPWVGENIIKPITVAEAYVASVVLEWIGYPNHQNGIHISSAEGLFSMEVRNNCNGVYESIVFLMAFIAIQIPWRRKIGWMVIGFVLFHIVNELRLITLFIIGSEYPRAFTFFHETFWNYALVLFTLAIFIFCAHKVSKAPVVKPRLTEADAP